MPVAGVERDEHPRPDTTAEKLASLKPAFRAGGTVTAGNASGINDGAAALVIASEERARELGIEPLGVFRGSAAAGVDPGVMGVGPIPAVTKLLARTGVAVGDIDLVELNEAFASQSLAVVRELGIDPDRVNVNGGAIALGHPLGMSGARLVVSLLHELRRREARARPRDAVHRRRPGAGRAVRARSRQGRAAARGAPARRRRTSRTPPGSRASRGWPRWPGRRPSGSS